MTASQGEVMYMTSSMIMGGALNSDALSGIHGMVGPSRLQLADVFGVDLIERRKLVCGCFAPVHRPVGLGGVLVIDHGWWLTGEK